MAISEAWQTREVTIGPIPSERIANSLANNRTKLYGIYVTAIIENGKYVITNRFDPTIIAITRPEATN